MFWLSRSFSLNMLRKVFEHSPFNVVTDQYGRLVICGNNEKNNQSDIQTILDTHMINAILIPCSKECVLYVKNKLHHVI